MTDVGIGYPSLSRRTDTLSDSEVQRVKLANHLQSRGEIYVLDETSTWLHGKDIKKLPALLRKLVTGVNTVIIVELRWLFLEKTIKKESRLRNFYAACN